MSKALTTRTSGVGGAVPALCSALLPGLGQFVNGESDKGIGVLAVAIIAGSSYLGAIPLLGGLAGLVYAGTWLYGVGDAYLTGRKK